jgi:hypothetical protein
MESDGGSALHGYGLRSLGAGATDAALLGPMVGPGFTETNGIAEDPAHDARMVAVHGQDTQAPLPSSPASPGTGSGGALSPLARLGVGTLPSAHLRGAAARSKPRASPRPMDASLLLKTPVLPGTASKPRRPSARSPSPVATDHDEATMVAASDAAAAAETRVLLETIDALQEENRSLKEKMAYMEHSSPTLANDSFFSSAEIASMKTDLEPTEIDDWLIIFSTLLFHKNTTAYEILSYSEEQWVMLRDDPTITKADSMTARAMMACFNGESLYVKRLRRKLAKQPSLMASGHALFHTLQDTKAFEVGEEEYDFQKAFSTKLYFQPGQSIMVNKLAAEKMEKDFKLMPAGIQGARHALLYALLDKMEMIPSLLKEAKSLRGDIWKADVLKQPTYTFDALASLAAIHMSKVGPLTTNSTDTAKRCINCGRTGHNWRECKAKCSKCALPFCPATYGKPCAASADTVPDEIYNAIGKPVPDWIKAKITARHKELHQLVTNSTFTAETEPDEYPSDDEAPFPFKPTTASAEVTPPPFKFVYTGAIEATRAHACDGDGYTSAESI